MAKKPRSDSKLDSLPDHQWAELCELLVAGEKYEAALAWLFDECGVSSSYAALSGFYKRHCVPILKERRSFAAMTAESLIADAGLTDWDAAILEKFKQKSFELMTLQGADPKDVSEMLKLFLKSQDQELNRRRFQDALTSKLEAGLDQLYEEIKGNDVAEKIFAELKKVLSAE